MNPTDVLKFWFEESTPADWFTKSEVYDAKIRERFLETHSAIRRGETASWRETPEGRLAEIIVLDQFSRNMFRGTPESFASDGEALRLALEAIQVGADRALPRVKRRFLYMPFMHSESWAMHRKALWLFFISGMWDVLRFEIDHARVIWKFGRYPSRNAILRRPPTREEEAFLTTHPGW